MPSLRVVNIAETVGRHAVLCKISMVSCVCSVLSRGDFSIQRRSIERIHSLGSYGSTCLGCKNGASEYFPLARQLSDHSGLAIFQTSLCFCPFDCHNIRAVCFSQLCRLRCFLRRISACLVVFKFPTVRLHACSIKILECRLISLLDISATPELHYICTTTRLSFLFLPPLCHTCINPSILFQTHRPALKKATRIASPNSSKFIALSHVLPLPLPLPPRNPCRPPGNDVPFRFSYLNNSSSWSLDACHVLGCSMALG